MALIDEHNNYMFHMTTPTKEEVDAYKGMYVPDLDSHAKGNVPQGNVRVTPDTPEKALWLDAINQALLDAGFPSTYGPGAHAKGGNANSLCIDCHFEVDCACPSATFTRQHIVKMTKDGGFKVKTPNWITKPIYNPSSHRKTYFYLFSTNIRMLEDGETYHFKDSCRPCPQKHTYRECAIDWLKSDRFETICDLVGLDVGYMRKKVGLI